MFFNVQETSNLSNIYGKRRPQAAATISYHPKASQTLYFAK